jgi:hypothetical protein
MVGNGSNGFGREHEGTFYYFVIPSEARNLSFLGDGDREIPRFARNDKRKEVLSER